jgi:hypothetical protein
MATTTNYSWSTPDDTALVKDGAAAIRSLGTAIDTTVFTNAGAAVTKATVDAKGDLIAGTADNTVARLAVGANNTVLTADSSTATGLKWATAAGGGMTLLSTTSLSGATTTISSIDQTYVNLVAIIYGVTNATADGILRIAPNNSTTITNSVRTDNGNGATWTGDSIDYLWVSGGAAMSRTVSANTFALTIFNYSSSTTLKPYIVSGEFQVTGNVRQDPLFAAGSIGGAGNDTTAITSLVISNSGGNLSTGTVLLYGVK